MATKVSTTSGLHSPIRGTQLSKAKGSHVNRKSTVSSAPAEYSKDDDKFSQLCNKQYCTDIDLINKALLKIEGILSGTITDSGAKPRHRGELNGDHRKLQTILKIITARLESTTGSLPVLTCYLGTRQNIIETLVYSSTSWSQFLKRAGKEAYITGQSQYASGHTDLIITITIDGSELLCCGCGFDSDGKMYEYLGQGCYSDRPLTISRLMRYCGNHVCDSVTIQEELRLIRKQRAKEGVNCGLYYGVM